MNVSAEVERILDEMAQRGTTVPRSVSRENVKLLMEIAFNEGQRIAYRESIKRMQTITTKTPVPADNLG